MLALAARISGQEALNPSPVQADERSLEAGLQGWASGPLNPSQSGGQRPVSGLLLGRETVAPVGLILGHCRVGGMSMVL